MSFQKIELFTYHSIKEYYRRILAWYDQNLRQKFSTHFCWNNLPM